MVLPKLRRGKDAIPTEEGEASREVFANRARHGDTAVRRNFKRHALVPCRGDKVTRIGRKGHVENAAVLAARGYGLIGKRHGYVSWSALLVKVLGFVNLFARRNVKQHKL